MARASRAFRVKQTRIKDGVARHSDETHSLFDLAPLTDILWNADLSMAQRIMALNDTAMAMGCDEPLIEVSDRKMAGQERRLTQMNEIAAAHKVTVPDALESVCRLNFENAHFCDNGLRPGERLVSSDGYVHECMPNLELSRGEGAEKNGMSSDRFEVIMRA